MKNELVARNETGTTVKHYFEGDIKGGLFAGGDIHATIYQSNIRRQFLNPGFKANYGFFSVIVCNYDDNLFELRKNKCRIMTEKSSSLFKNEIEGKTNVEVANLLMTYPTIVLRPNEENLAYYGFITRLENNSDTYTINFFVICPIPVSFLFDRGRELGIDVRPLHNSLQEERWIVRKGNLKQIALSSGIEIPIL